MEEEKDICVKVETQHHAFKSRLVLNFRRDLNASDAVFLPLLRGEARCDTDCTFLKRTGSPDQSLCAL